MRAAAVALTLVVAACSTKREEPAASPGSPGDTKFDEPAAIEPAIASQATGGGDAEAESAHHVVFADRTSQAYLLLLDGERPTLPTRTQLIALVRDKMPAAKYEAELALLEKLIATEPPPPGFAGIPDDERARLMRDDLLGLHLDLLPVAPRGEEPLVSPEVLTEPLFTRELSAAERASAPARRHALLLRADYRNQFAVRGLRLLQTLVRVVASDRSALIHDPDTNETMNVEGFTRRRLQASIGNIADQIALVPFVDDTGEGLVRMTTRGMRRFGSVDLELQGLPREPAQLERATLLLVGLAYKMVRMGEYDPGGYAVEVDDVIELSRNDVVQAFAGRPSALPDCAACNGEVRLHLVERAPKDTDPEDHVVAIVVAPRASSEAADYDHAAWSAKAMDELLGVPSRP